MDRNSSARNRRGEARTGMRLIAGYVGTAVARCTWHARFATIAVRGRSID